MALVFSFTKWNFFVLTNVFLDLKKRNPLVLTKQLACKTLLCQKSQATTVKTATEARRGKKAIGLIKQNNNFARASRFFVHFNLCCHYTAMAWKCLIPRFIEDVNSGQRLSFSFPELSYSPLEFNSRKRDGISAIKFEAGRIHFQSDVFVAVAVVRGGSRIFFRRGCTRLSLYFSTNKPHSFFFLQNTSCIRKLQVIPGGGGCVPPAPSPWIRPWSLLLKLPNTA